MSTAVLCIRRATTVTLTTEGLAAGSYDIILPANLLRFRPSGRVTICWCCGTKPARPR